MHCGLCKAVPLFWMYPLQPNPDLNSSFTSQPNEKLVSPTNKVLDVKLLVPYVSEYANSLTNNFQGWQAKQFFIMVLFC